MSVFRLALARFPRFGPLVLLAASLGMVSCADEMCEGSPYELVKGTLDSAVWIVGSGDSIHRGRMSGGPIQMLGSDMVLRRQAVGTSPVPRFHVAFLSGWMIAEGREGDPDTTIAFRVDSLRTIEADPRKAGIRTTFRSLLTRGSDPYWIDLWEESDSASGAITRWDLRGEVECSLPIDQTYPTRNSYTCRYEASSEDHLGFHLRVEVVAQPAKPYPCEDRFH